MKGLKIIFLAMGVLVMGEGCKVLQSSTHTANTVTSDSTTTKVTERFVPVYLPGDTVVFVEQMQCPEDITPRPVVVTPVPFKKEVKGKHSNGSVEVDKLGRLIAVFSCDEWKDSVKVLDTEISRLQTLIQTDSTTTIVPVKFIPKVYKASMWFSGSILLLLLLWLVWQGAKLYSKFKI